MKSTFLPLALQNNTKRIHLGIALVVALMSRLPNAAASVPTIDLGTTATSFAVLAGSGIVNAGTTTITGDVGSFPTATIAGFGTVTLNGTSYDGGLVAQNAQNDFATAYADALGRSPTTVYGAIFDLGGLTLTSGVYNDPSSFGITGTLTLDAQGDPNAVWIFQAGSTLTTVANSTVNLVGGARAANVFWLVGSSATLGADSAFAGSILAYTSITVDTGVADDGRLLAQNGAVSLDSDSITVTATPEPGSMLLLGCGLATLVIFRRRISWTGCLKIKT